MFSACLIKKNDIECVEIICLRCICLFKFRNDNHTTKVMMYLSLSQ